MRDAKKMMKMLNLIIGNHIQKYFYGKPTPENIKDIEASVNKHLFKEFQVDGFLFELELSSERNYHVAVEGVKVFKDGVRINEV